MNTKILGWHTGHDPNVCFLDLDNKTILHIEEERISRIKHGNERTLNKEYMKLVDNFSKEKPVIGYTFNSYDSLDNKYLKDINPYCFINKTFSDNKFFYHQGNKIYLVNHHLSHAAYVYYTRSIHMDKCDILVYDGWGWDTDQYFFDSDLNVVNNDPIFLGRLWNFISGFVFKKEFQEGKVMGLAARGNLDNGLYNHLEKLIPTLQNSLLNIDEKEKKKFSRSFNFGYNIKDNKDFAFTLQKFSEDFILKYLKKHKTSSNLCISGGIGLNGYINQRIVDEGLYDNVYIAPATGDCGLGVGSALFVANKIKETRFNKVGYLGKSYDIPNIGTEYPYEKLYPYIAQKISEGKIIGWYQGRSESGPRALGNRSILTDPRTVEMKDHLNSKVKHREWFRPFAPAILKEHTEEWFENIKEAPYMLKIAKYKPGMGEKVGAVCHVDYTGRVQTVGRDDNEHFYNLIKAFYDITGVPILLNTSFNDQEPIVESPSDALQTFRGTGIDILVLGNKVIEK